MAASSETQEIRGDLGGREPEAYRLTIEGVDHPTFILGPYLSNIGGCDRIRPYERIFDLIERYETRGHVVFEGVLVSDNYGRMGELLEARGKNAAIVYLDTPLEECLRSVKGRTEKGSSTKHVEHKFHEILKVRGWFLENDKVQIIDVSRKTGLDAVLGLLRRGKVDRTPRSDASRLRKATPGDLFG